MTEHDEVEEQPDEELERLEHRIRDLKRPKRGDRQFAHGMVLAVSLGVVVAACLVGAYQFGHYLEQKYDSQLYLLLALFGGFVVAGTAAWKLMQPLMKD